MHVIFVYANKAFNTEFTESTGFTETFKGMAIVALSK